MNKKHKNIHFEMRLEKQQELTNWNFKLVVCLFVYIIFELFNF